MNEGEKGITVVAIVGIAVAVVLTILLIQKLTKQQNQTPPAGQIHGPNGLE